jgi:hypothetical protein
VSARRRALRSCRQRASAPSMAHNVPREHPGPSPAVAVCLL